MRRCRLRRLPRRGGERPEYVIPLQNTTQQPDLTFMSDRDARKALFDDS